MVFSGVVNWFRVVFFQIDNRREDNGENGKSLCILIVPDFHFFYVKFLKLSTQWVKYALGCVYIDLFIGEMKKKSENVRVHRRWKIV